MHTYEFWATLIIKTVTHKINLVLIIGYFSLAQLINMNYSGAGIFVIF